MRDEQGHGRKVPTPSSELKSLFDFSLNFMFLFEKLLNLVITKTFPDVKILVYLHACLPEVEGIRDNGF